MRPTPSSCTRPATPKSPTRRKTWSIFTKPSTSVIGPDDPIVYPACSKDMNFEPEVAVVMGRIAKNVTVENAMDYVLGFTCVNDVTLRDLQGLDPMWTRAKGFDTSCPLGPWIVTRERFGIGRTRRSPSR